MLQSLFDVGDESGPTQLKILFTADPTSNISECKLHDRNRNVEKVIGPLLDRLRSPSPTRVEREDQTPGDGSNTSEKVWMHPRNVSKLITATVTTSPECFGVASCHSLLIQKDADIAQVFNTAIFSKKKRTVEDCVEDLTSFFQLDIFEMAKLVSNIQHCIDRGDSLQLKDDVQLSNGVGVGFGGDDNPVTVENLIYMAYTFRPCHLFDIVMAMVCIEREHQVRGCRDGDQENVFDRCLKVIACAVNREGQDEVSSSNDTEERGMYRTRLEIYLRLLLASGRIELASEILLQNLKIVHERKSKLKGKSRSPRSRATTVEAPQSLGETDNAEKEELCHSLIRDLDQQTQDVLETTYDIHATASTIAAERVSRMQAPPPEAVGDWTDVCANEWLQRFDLDAILSPNDDYDVY